MELLQLHELNFLTTRPSSVCWLLYISAVRHGWMGTDLILAGKIKEKYSLQLGMEVGHITQVDMKEIFQI